VPEIAPGQSATVEFRVVVTAHVPNGVFALTADVRHAAGQAAGYGAVTVAIAPTGTPWLSELGPVSAQVGWGSLGLDRSVDGNPLTIAGTVHARGVAPHAPSELTYYLGGNCTRFTSLAGVDDETGGRGAVTFTVAGDGATLAETGVVRGGEAAVAVDADVTGVTELVLATGTGPDDDKNYDHSEWVDAAVTCAG
jgi:alpha-galactosidase